jgi:bacterioferritin (cytochrome b1)
MAQDTELLEQLNAALQTAYKVTFQYLQNSYMVKGLGRPSMVQWLRAQAQKEQQDAIRLGDKIVALGGVPTTEVPEITHFTQSAEILRESIGLEESSIRDYQTCIDLANERGDTSLRVLLEELLANAENDLEEINKMLEE